LEEKHDESYCGREGPPQAELQRNAKSSHKWYSKNFVKSQTRQNSSKYHEWLLKILQAILPVAALPVAVA
jgi:hypothetical protein